MSEGGKVSPDVVKGEPQDAARGEPPGVVRDEPPAGGKSAPAGPMRVGWLHRLFRAGVWLKGADGILELAAGALLAVASGRQILSVAGFLTQRELSEDPHDLVANALLSGAHHLAMNARGFAAAYLLVHGAVKLVLVAGLLAERRRAFPVALVVLGLFVSYQVYRVAMFGSPVLAVLTVIDIGIIALVAREWRVLERAHHAGGPGG